MADALIGISKELGSKKVTLPFGSYDDFTDFYFESSYRDIVERSKNLYEWKIRDRTLPFRERVPNYVFEEEDLIFKEERNFNMSE